MSTRCQIQAVEDGKVEGRIYRHSDGYPDGESGVIAELKRFLERPVNYGAYGGNGRARLGDWDYFLAGLIREGVAFGVCATDESGIHGDIEYLYSLSAKDGKLHVKVEHRSDDRSFRNTKHGVIL